MPTVRSVRSVIGIAGVDRPEDHDILQHMLRRLGFRQQPVRIVNDAHIALVAGAPEGSGIVLVSGTGSIAYGVDRQGGVARSGGWGYLLGDEGSAFWLGHAAVRQGVRSADGRGPRTILFERICREVGVDHPSGLVKWFYDQELSRYRVAQLASLVQGAADDGDEQARALLDQAAQHLARAARAVARQLDLQRALLVGSLGRRLQGVPQPGVPRRGEPRPAARQSRAARVGAGDRRRRAGPRAARRMISARPRLLVVNADDLGRTAGINEGIFDAHERGIVSSATLMVGFAAAAKAAAALADHPRLGVGLHVTLTGAGPTLPASRVPSLVGVDARFPAKPELIREPDPTELRAEIRHQLEIFRDLVHRDPTHLDSHHHSHRHPAVLDAVIEVARTHGLPVRASSPAVAAALRAAGVATSDVFVERFFGDEARRDVLLSILDDLPPGSTELMCHPAVVDDELRAGSSYAEPRARELEVLTDPALHRELAARGIRLARFDEACAS